MCHGPRYSLIVLCSLIGDPAWFGCGHGRMFKLEDIYRSCIGVASYQSGVMERDMTLPFCVFSIIGKGTTIQVHVVCMIVGHGYGSLHGVPIISSI